MVIATAIGDYDKKKKDSEIDGAFENLYVINNDIKTIVNLFGVRLNYKIFPKYNADKSIKKRWSKKEVFELLKKRAKYLDESVKNNEHDSLIVIISSHGIQDHILTSDYQKMNKDTIHRIFTVDEEKAELPELRLNQIQQTKQQK